jgi:hypothetical protein
MKSRTNRRRRLRRKTVRRRRKIRGGVLVKCEENDKLLVAQRDIPTNKWIFKTCDCNDTNIKIYNEKLSTIPRMFHLFGTIRHIKVTCKENNIKVPDFIQNRINVQLGGAEFLTGSFEELNKIFA